MSDPTPESAIPECTCERLPWEAQWDRPQPVSKIDLAFSARGLELAPAYEQVNEAIAAWDDETLGMWNDFGAKVFTMLFFDGVGIKQFMVYEGIDGETAWWHLQVVAGCYGFKHQHKEAALSYLASRWFASVEYQARDARVR